MKKKAMTLVFAVISALFFAVGAVATPYTGSDIELKGRSFSASSGFSSDPLVSGDMKWHLNGDSVFTAWSGRWIEYMANLTAGNWNIGINVINNGMLGTGWYSRFQVLNSATNQIINIPASDTEVMNGYVNVNVLADSAYVVRYTWLNDQYQPPRDANIQINSAFFDNTATQVPEPMTILLLASGFVGLVASRKYSRG